MGQLKANWTRGGSELSAQEHQITVTEGDLPGGMRLDAPIQIEGHDEPLILKDYFESILGDHRLMEDVFRKWLSFAPTDRPESFSFNVATEPSRSLRVEASDQSLRTIQKLSVNGTVTVSASPLDLQKARFQGHQIAFATEPNVFQKQVGGPEYVIVNLVGDENGISKAGLLIPATGGKEADFKEMKPAIPPENP